MSTAISFIPIYTAITLLMGGFNEFSTQLTLVGTLAITLHAAITPTDPTGPYPNFDNYHPTQPPLRDYVLVFGLASLALLALFSRICSSFWPLVRGQFTFKIEDTRTDQNPRPIARTPSPSHTSTSQWTATTSTLAAGSLASITQANGPHEVVDSPETITLKLRVSRLEAALEEMSCRLDALTTGEQGVDKASGVTTTVVTKVLPVLTPAHPLDITLPSPTQSLSLSQPPSPIDPNSTPLSAMKPVDETIDAREHLRSLVRFIMEENRKTDQLILNMRGLLAKANTPDDTTLDSCKGEGEIPSVPPTSLSSPSTTPPSPFTRPDQPIRAPAAHRVRHTSLLPLAMDRMGKTTEDSRGTPKFDLAPDFSDLSQAPCSTPLRSVKEVEESIPSPPLSFLCVLEADSDPQDPPSAPAFKRVKEADARVHPPTRETSALTKVLPQVSTPRCRRDFVPRIRERSLKNLYPPPSLARAIPPLDTRRDVKGKGKAVRALASMSDWLVEYRRRRNIRPEGRPFHRDCYG